jgi:hypothetical protein
MTEVRGQRSEVGGQRSEGMGKYSWKQAAGRGRNFELRISNF